MATQMTQKAAIRVQKAEDKIAARDWEPIYKLVVRHGPQQVTEHLAVPHYTKRNVWVLPGGVEATSDELIEMDYWHSSTLLWPRYWTKEQTSAAEEAL
ncbi:MAG: hypothetical protein EBR82_29725 [Caulobacteraceae bacterium]|jgi:hypothetical protein|nr:hypothetical protein [Caulobacteraceae bacterium]